MSDRIIDSIVKYVMQQEEVKNIKLTWFGGEPLMAQKEMKKFYDTFRENCDKEIVSDIITTGYH